MALNYPGPYEVRIYYTVSSRVHIQRLNCQMSLEGDPGDAFDQFVPLQRNGSAVTPLDTHVDNWIAVIKMLYNTANSFDYAELWKYAAESFEATYYSTYDIAVSGGTGGAAVVAGQLISTFRTQEGGTLKINLMETNQAVGVGVGYTGLGTNQKAVVDYVLAPENIWLGRDTSYPFAFNKMFPGQNERLFKKIYR